MVFSFIGSLIIFHKKEGQKLKNLLTIIRALEYIEEHIDDKLSQEDIAKYCFCSLSGLQKTFHYACHHSVGDYISKRRMSLAARELINSPASVTEIALKYQYGSPEAFARAFTNEWGESPSKFRKNRKFSELMPRLDVEAMIKNTEGGRFMGRKVADISELYGILKERNESYIIAFDIINLDPVNKNIGRTAGDKVISECIKRIDEAAEDNMLFFRIGGDEFVLVTEYDDPDEAVKLSEKITSHNGTPISFEGADIPVGMRCGITKVSSGKTLRYGELFTRCIDSIDFTRNGSSSVAVSPDE